MRKKALRQLGRDHQTSLNTGKGEDRRKDKLETAVAGVHRWAQRYRNRYASVGK